MNVFSFLLPSSTLDWLFFTLLGGWLFLSLFAVKKVQEETNKNIKSIQFNNLNTSTSNLHLSLRNPFWDHIVENSAGFSLIIGLLGTFLGIGLAIQGAGEILANLNSQSSSSVKDMRDTMNGLSPILGEIGMKFKVSAWGIIVHIILRISIPFFKLDETRQEAILKRVEIENQTKTNQRNEIFEIFNKNNELTKAMLAELKVIASAPSEIDKKVDILSKSISNFEQTVNDLSTTINQELFKLTNTIETLKSETKLILNEMNTTIYTVKEETNSTLSTFSNLAGNVISNGVAGLSATNTIAQRLLNNLEEKLDEDKLKKIIDNVSNLEIVIGAIENISTEINNTFDQQNKKYLPLLENAIGNKGSLNTKLENLINTSNGLELILQKNISINQGLNTTLIRLNSDKKIRVG